MERLEEAVQVLRKALNQNPNSAVAHTLLARACGCSTAMRSRWNVPNGQSR